MRTIKELLELMLNHLIEQKKINSGLCEYTYDLFIYNLITDDEYMLLIDFINNYTFCQKISYLFPKGEYEPRINWLKERINELN